MFLEGRWFLGQVRNDTNFDWRLLRIPRWVPYEVWQDWQQRGLKPEERDGPWGEAEHGDPFRGYANFIGSRKSAITKSAADNDRIDESFRFLEFLLTNQDFNQVLLIEDGMGANMAAAHQYLAQPDPLFPAEEDRRSAQHELSALERLRPSPLWPYDNFGNTGFQKLNGDLTKSWLNNPITAEELKLPSRPLPYDYRHSVLPPKVIRYLVNI